MTRPSSKATNKAQPRQRVPTASTPEINHESRAQPELEPPYDEMHSVPEEDDELTLTRAKSSWLLGEWDALTTLDVQSVQAHPDRAALALLIASAHLQLGEQQKARKCIQIALDYGCPRKQAAQVLIAGVHNTLGRAAALRQDETHSTRHFTASITPIETKDPALAGHIRSVRELARIGLLPQAATLLDDQLQRTDELRHTPRQQAAHFAVLRTEIELLRDELSLAQRRQQLFTTAPVRDQTLTGAQPSDPKWLSELKKRAVSQLGQELWVLEQTGYKREGFFVEFGATDGISFSNTWLLEKEFAWRGICAEPNPKFLEELARNRSCITSNACIGGKTGDRVNFVFADAYGGMQQHLTLDKHSDKRTAYLDLWGSKTLETISLHDFLTQHGAPHDIDYMSIDTEGSEYEILKSFPFDQWNIRLLTIEHNHSPQHANIRALMKRHGYHYVEKKWDDWYRKA